MIMGKLKNSVLILLSCCLLAACEGSNHGTKASSGHFLGFKSKKATDKMRIGAFNSLAGGLVGGIIGDVMDDGDRKIAEQTTQHTLENIQSGKIVEWNNPNNKHHGTVSVIKTYQKADEYCRNYIQTITIDDKTEEAFGVACRKLDGHWVIIK